MFVDGPDKIALTPPQEEIMAIYRRWRKERGISPSFREMAAIRKCNPATVYQHVQALVRKGALADLGGTRRQYVPWDELEEYERQQRAYYREAKKTQATLRG